MVSLMITETNVLIIGGGVAGLVAALELGDRGIDVVVISSGEGPASTNSYRAQGGIGYHAPDEPKGLFKKDIMNAGAGLCNENAVDQLIQLGPRAIEEILNGTPFEKEINGDDQQAIPSLLRTNNCYKLHHLSMLTPKTSIGHATSPLGTLQRPLRPPWQVR